jgi:NAD(P)-dependent dehydrogenase (short-subunit alcohol dehydrogenase family)
VHGTGSILDAKVEDAQVQYEGNFLSAFLGLHALLPPLVAQKSGQVVINTSASGLRPAPFAALYSAQRAGANTLVRCAGQTVAPHGVTVNATGTYAMDYPDFLHDVGADKDPAKRKEVEAQVPVQRLCKPEEAAYFVAGLLDGKNMFQTSQFFAIDGGWAFM